MKNFNKAEKIVDWITGIFLSCLILFTIIWRSLGGNILTMTTPSMSPILPIGSVVLTLPQKQKVRVGEIVAFNVNDGSIHATFVHRVYQVYANGDYRTKGDRNGSPDVWIMTPANTIGHKVFVLPIVGYILMRKINHSCIS